MHLISIFYKSLNLISNINSEIQTNILTQTNTEGLNGFYDCKGVLRQTFWETLNYSKFLEFSQTAPIYI